jgi:hypothetical protein
MSGREAPWWLRAVGYFFAFRALSPLVVTTLLVGGLWLLASAGWDSFVEFRDHGGAVDRSLVPSDKVIVSFDHDNWTVENHGTLTVGRVIVSCRDQFDGEYAQSVPEVVSPGGSVSWNQPPNLDRDSMACRVSNYAVFRR